MNIFWDIHHRSQMDRISSKSDRTDPKADRMERELRTMRQELDRVTLACQGLWELVREHSDITEAMLADRIAEIDLRDGMADGKMSPQVITCPACGRKTNSKRGICYMCGEPVKGDHILDG